MPSLAKLRIYQPCTSRNAVRYFFSLARSSAIANTLLGCCSRAGARLGSGGRGSPERDAVPGASSRRMNQRTCQALFI
jgi:hypothetical protein